MPDYSKGKIYCIRSFQTDDVYIGSTVLTLSQRLGKHRNDYKLYLKGKKNYVSSFELLKYDDYYIELITLYPCSCKAELVAEEGHYIREWDCVNKRIEGRTQKQWQFDNKDKIKERNKKHYINNRDKHREKCKKYRINNRVKLLEKQTKYYFDNKSQRQKYYKQKLSCICGNDVSIRNIRRHIKSKKHKKLMSEFIQNFISH